MYAQSGCTGGFWLQVLVVVFSNSNGSSVGISGSGGGSGSSRVVGVVAVEWWW